MNRRTLATRLAAMTALGITMPRAARGQTPAASPVAASDIRYADVPGIALALSPDGTMLAGVLDRERIVVWDTETLETVAESAPLDELSIIDETSLAWSPDGSALTWSLLATVQLRDSDIYLFDVDSGEIVNLTDDNPTDRDAVSLPLFDVPDDFEPLNVDVLPSWTADGESIVFARTIWDGDSDAGTSLVRIPRSGGDATDIATLSRELPFLASSIRAGMDDGSVLYATWPPAPDSPELGVFLATPDGEIEPISTGMFVRDIPAPVLMDVAPAARKAAVISAHNYAELARSAGPIFVEIDLDTGIPTAFEKILGLPEAYTEAIREGVILQGSPAFVTKAAGTLDGYVYATSDTSGGITSVWRHGLSSGETELLGTLYREDVEIQRSRAYSRVEIGANGTVAVYYGGNAWLTSIDL